MLEEIRKKVEEKLSKKRFKHTLSTEKAAAKLAQRYGVDEEKARIAALLHDYCKEDKLHVLQEVCRENYGNMLEDYMDMNEVLHGFAAAAVVKKEFGIEDEEILEGIKYHTVGRRGLSLFAKIIYIADAIEEDRDYPGVDKIRELVKENLDAGILYELNRKLKYLIEKDGIIHLNTLDMRNWLLKPGRE